MNEPSARPYRQRRRAASAQATSRRILDAARRVLGDGTTFDIDAIAAAAGVARSTVYRAFGSRSGLIEALAEDLDTEPGHSFAGDSDATANLPVGFVEDGVLLDRLRALATVEQETTAAERLAGLDSRPSPRRPRRLLLPSASDISDWARRRDAQQLLPQLVRRLITATCTVKRLDFRAGEGISLPGWDGIADIAEDHFLAPSGISGWEMGTDEQVARKAQHDFEARRGSPGELDPAETSFVFVTPRRWSMKRSWSTKRRTGGVWRDVRVLDADDLETWLETAPAVHVWLAEEMGLQPAGVSTLEGEWADWAGNTNPGLTPGLVVGGRTVEASRITDWSGGPAGALVVRTDSDQDAMMFIAASLLLDAGRHADVLARAVVVRSRDSWRLMSSSRTPALLLPMFEDPDVAEAVRNGHRVLTPAGNNQVAAGEVILLPRLRREAARAALLEMGVAGEAVEALAQVARLSLNALHRRLAISSRRRLPGWASHEHSGDLLAPLLAGAWDSASEGDRRAMSDLAGRPYSEVAASATRWANGDDPPLRRDGSSWLLVSKEDAWSLLASQLTSDDFQRFKKVALEVVGAADPASELPPDDRWMAAVKGKARGHTSILRGGLADTIALLGGYATSTELADGRTGAAWANQIVWELLHAAEADTTGAVWLGLSDELPLLAEAAPEVFLDVVEAAVSANPSPMHSLFFDAETSHPFGRATHAGLLWGLEGIAWSDEHLSRVAILLGALSRQDPGGRWSNRPSNTLREIFLPWHPQTAASLSDRLAALDLLRQRYPDEGWSLLLALVPGAHEIAMPTHAPRWRSWKAEDPAQTRRDWGETIDQVVARAIQDAGADGVRWARLIEHAERLPQSSWVRVTASLGHLRADQLLPERRRELADALRSVIQRHRAFPDAPWSMPEDRLGVLDALHQRFDPGDPVDRHRWLFDDRARLLEVTRGDWGSFQLAILKARMDALREVLAAAEWSQQLGRLIEAVARPWHVGWALAHLADDTKRADLAWFLSEAPPYLDAARGYAAGMFTTSGPAWAEEVIAHPTVAWTSDGVAALLESLPGRPDVWAIVSKVDRDAQAAYWSSFRQVVRPEDATEAAEKLLEFGNARHAVSVLGMQAADEDSAFDPELAMRALEASIRDPSVPSDGAMFEYDLSELLKRLDAFGIPPDRLAPLEWAYLPLLREDSRPILALHRALAADPRFFSEVVAMVYRSDTDEPHESTPEESGRARRAWELLHGWKHSPGVIGANEMDAQALRAWVNGSRQLLRESGRSAIGDELIGQALKWSPPGDDGVWPHPVLRDLLETMANADIERGLSVEMRNSRGVTMRGPTDGGEQERELAQKYRNDAALVEPRWSRARALLGRLADEYEQEAVFEDARAALIEDT